jgi:hypothetical protein
MIAPTFILARSIDRSDSIPLGTVSVSATSSSPVISSHSSVAAHRSPALITPTLTYPAAFEEDVLAPVMSEHIAHRQPRLTPADDDGVVLLSCW